MYLVSISLMSAAQNLLTAAPVGPPHMGIPRSHSSRDGGGNWTRLHMRPVELRGSPCLVDGPWAIGTTSEIEA